MNKNRTQQRFIRFIALIIICLIVVAAIASVWMVAQAPIATLTPPIQLT